MAGECGAAEVLRDRGMRVCFIVDLMARREITKAEQQRLDRREVTRCNRKPEQIISQSATKRSRPAKPRLYYLANPLRADEFC
jgi:hypothetical protein